MLRMRAEHVHDISVQAPTFPELMRHPGNFTIAAESEAHCRRPKRSGPSLFPLLDRIEEHQGLGSDKVGRTEEALSASTATLVLQAKAVCH